MTNSFSSFSSSSFLRTVFVKYIDFWFFLYLCPPSCAQRTVRERTEIAGGAAGAGQMLHRAGVLCRRRYSRRRGDVRCGQLATLRIVEDEDALAVRIVEEVDDRVPVHGARAEGGLAGVFLLRKRPPTSHLARVGRRLPSGMA